MLCRLCYTFFTIIINVSLKNGKFQTFHKVPLCAFICGSSLPIEVVLENTRKSRQVSLCAAPTNRIWMIMIIWIVFFPVIPDTSPSKIWHTLSTRVTQHHTKFAWRCVKQSPMSKVCCCFFCWSQESNSLKCYTQEFRPRSSSLDCNRRLGCILVDWRRILDQVQSNWPCIFYIMSTTFYYHFLYKCHWKSWNVWILCHIALATWQPYWG